MRARERRLLQGGGIALGVIACLAITFLVLNAGPATKSRGDGLFSIEKGWSLSRISRELRGQGYIRFAPLLDAVGRLKGTQGDFKAGYYRIPSGATTLAIHQLLVEGAQTIGKVTLPEGWTSAKIARHLEAEGVCTAADFLSAISSPELLAKFGIPGKSLEGFLYPDTYFVPRPFPAQTLVQIMVGTFFENLGKVAPDWKELGQEKLRDRVIMASIVEREYRVENEAPLIASVFFNRLRLNIGLESCATLEYIITEIQQKAHPEYITRDDEKVDSPYNTYRWAGLPPGPISNPGKIALEAAFHPPRSEYLYFVLRDPQTGRHYFSRNLNEHNQAKYLYLKKP
jgi:UPF0755 protein